MTPAASGAGLTGWICCGKSIYSQPRIYQFLTSMYIIQVLYRSVNLSALQTPQSLACHANTWAFKISQNCKSLRNQTADFSDQNAFTLLFSKESPCVVTRRFQPFVPYSPNTHGYYRVTSLQSMDSAIVCKHAQHILALISFLLPYGSTYPLFEGDWRHRR